MAKAPYQPESPPMRPIALLAVPLLASLVAGCMTPVAPVEVTRFHRIEATQALAPGRYRIVQPDMPVVNEPTLPVGGTAPGLEWQTYAAAVSRQLDLLGFRAARMSDSVAEEYVVTLSVDQASSEIHRESPVNVGLGGSTGSYGSGLGVGVGINLNSLFGGGSGTMVDTRMAVRITRTGDSLPLWEGRAQTQARVGAPAAQPGLNADKLATALFRGFPGRSGETITVP